MYREQNRTIVVNVYTPAAATTGKIVLIVDPNAVADEREGSLGSQLVPAEVARTPRGCSRAPSGFLITSLLASTCGLSSNPF